MSVKSYFVDKDVNCKYILIITHKSSNYLLMGTRKTRARNYACLFRIKNFVDENRCNEVGQEVCVNKDTLGMVIQT